MNANTALKINEAIDQAVRCGELRSEILTQVDRALLQAERQVAEADLREAQERVRRLYDPKNG